MSRAPVRIVSQPVFAMPVDAFLRPVDRLTLNVTLTPA